MTGMMRIGRGALRAAMLAGAVLLAALPARAATTEEVIALWYRLTLELVRHTPTYSPPVASRSFAYIGVTAHEARVGAGRPLVTLAGQLNGLAPLPPRDAAAAYAEPALMQAALSGVVGALFANTGPTGQRALAAVTAQLDKATAEGVDPASLAASRAQGQAVAAHVLAWAATDGGATIANLGFPDGWPAADRPGAWTPTSRVALQQAPLLPGWGDNRTFAMTAGDACPLPPPPAYSEDPASEFHAEAREVYETAQTLTPEQAVIARFWADDAMLSVTPPGHWISIAGQLLAEDGADADRMAEVYARLGVALADAFVACWHAKFEYDLLRPVTYIRKQIDPKWEPLLNTPPFPEYPSGHSTQSGAAATVLTAIFGDARGFTDGTGSADGLAPRRFASFWDAAEEAGISRLYAGIHFRAAIERGLEQGRCVGARAVALRTRSE